jgi:hypothetical protein
MGTSRGRRWTRIAYKAADRFRRRVVVVGGPHATFRGGMRAPGRSALAGLVCVVLAGGAIVAAAPAQDYAVRLARPSAAGDRRLAAGWLQTEDRATGGPKGAATDQRQSSTIRYVVATEVLEASPRGNARRATLTVRRLTKESAGVTAELARPGTEVTARLVGHERVFEMQGARLAPDLQVALAAAVSLRADDEPTDDDLFGTAQRRRVGESWPVDGGLFARSGAPGTTFDPRDVAGTVTLASLKSAGGVPCLEVRWKLEARHGSFTPGSLPAGLSGTMTSMSVTGSTVLPIDDKLQPLSRETAIAGVGDFTGSASDGSPFSARHELRQVFHVELSKVP